MINSKIRHSIISGGGCRKEFFLSWVEGDLIHPLEGNKISDWKTLACISILLWISPWRKKKKLSISDVREIWLYRDERSLLLKGNIQFSSVQSLSRVRLFATPWIAARQASLSITISRSSLRLMSIKSLIPFSPSHPQSSPSPPAHNPSQHQSLFQWLNSSHEVAKLLEFQL